MNLLAHMSFVVVLDYVFFRYWYDFANRFDVLLVHEPGFLPGRYIISGVVAGAFIYWIYMVPIALLNRFWKGYRHPRWWLLWSATAGISSIQVMQILRDSEPQISTQVAAALVAHLQMIHFMMFMVADRVMHRNIGAIIPGVRSALVLMGDWVFWIWFSFHVRPEGRPFPDVGSGLERYILLALVLALIVIGVVFRAGLEIPYVHRYDVVIPTLNITVADLIDSFYSAWTLFYLIVPVVHYFLRGYVMAHNHLFDTHLTRFLIPAVWSLVLMWGIIFISKANLSWRQLRLMFEFRKM